LVIELFEPFELKFNFFFGELERLFINEVVVNLYARIYKPGDTVIEPSSSVSSIMFLYKGQLAVCEPFGDPFCILTEGCYFGDY